tara:strand:+ start:1049 stop:1216 length:168 start_codon:yes stop_codon:yes gene_type:complete
MFISQPFTSQQRQTLATLTPACVPAMLCWASSSAMSVWNKPIVREHKMKQEVYLT